MHFLFLGILSHLKDWILKSFLSDLNEWGLKNEEEYHADIAFCQMCFSWVGKKL